MWSVITSLLGVTRWLSCDYMANNPMWYISVLLLCYIMFFYSTYIGKKLRINSYLFYCIILSFGIIMRGICDKVGYCYPFFSEVIGRGYSCFFWGLIMQFLLEKFVFLKKEKNLSWQLVGIAIFIYAYSSGNVFVKEYLWYILCFIFYSILILLFRNKLFQKIFCFDNLKYVGDIAYNAFIWHLPIIRLLVIVSYIFEIEICNFQFMLITTILVFIMGVFSYLFIDTNIRRILLGEK